MQMKKFSGNIVDVNNKRIFKGSIEVDNGKILSVKEEHTNDEHYIVPGLVDAHVHVESSMLIPSEFARVASVHGTVTCVSDPHEIANVCGINGVKFMINNGKKVPFRFYFGAPSCVPATDFESSGAVLGPDGIDELLSMDEVIYLAEMMNFPGVLYNDKIVYEKINIAKKYNKVIDGHAPGLIGDEAAKYANAGITTDHECINIEEAIAKIKNGMLIQVREGSAAKNFDALIELLNIYPDNVMFCSDDKHPNDLIKGHINLLVKRAIKAGYDPIKVLRACTAIPVNHYGLDSGLLRKGDNADFIIVDNLNDFNVLETYINGKMVAQNGTTLINSVNETPINNFNAKYISADQLKVKAENDTIRVIEAYDGQLVTGSKNIKANIKDGFIECNTENDIAKIVVLNRYNDSKPSVAFITGFGFKRGAIASTVAHDSHNIIAIGLKDTEITSAVNALIDAKGGVCVSENNIKTILPLPVAGLMSNTDAYSFAQQYENIDKKAVDLCSGLTAPLMTLSFMALLVLPDLKISDKGLFDGKKFKFTSIFDTI
jgi:adenine deaminase